MIVFAKMCICILCVHVSLSIPYISMPSFTEMLQEIEQNSEALLDGSCPEGSTGWKKSYFITQRALAMCQDSGDEKLHLLATISEHIENRTRSLDQYRENLGMAFCFGLLLF